MRATAPKPVKWARDPYHLPAKMNSALTLEQANARTAFSLALNCSDIPHLAHICGAVLVHKYDGWPGEHPGAFLVSCAELAKTMGECYEDGEPMASAGSRHLCALRDAGIIEVRHDHSHCTGDELPPLFDGGPPECAHAPGKDSHHCRCLVLVRPPEEWVPPPPREPHQRRPPYDPERACPQCGTHRCKPTRFRCFGCGHNFDWNEKPGRSKPRNTTVSPPAPHLVLLPPPVAPAPPPPMRNVTHRARPVLLPQPPRERCLDCRAVLVLPGGNPNVPHGPSPDGERCVGCWSRHHAYHPESPHGPARQASDNHGPSPP